MGGKITIDSATLMNKGLEVIEAHHLFGTPYDRIDVVVHPQSIVHALVQLCDGASLAHLGHPDMRVPIAYALHHPERVDVPVPALDLAQVGSLTFEPPDLEAFPACGLARDAARAGGTAPCVLNAANEVAVHAFLGERLGFIGIPAVIEGMLEQLPARARALASSRSTRPTPRRAGSPASSWPRRRSRELVPGLRRLRRADHPARARATSPPPRRSGCASSASRSSSRRDEAALAARRDRVRRRLAPARRLREDHRDEPGGGDPAGGRPPRLLPPAGVEADRGDRRRPGGQHLARVRDPDGRSSWPIGDVRRPRRSTSRRVEPGSPAAARAQARRPDPRRRRPHRLPDRRCASRSPRTAARASRSRAARPPSPPCW